MALCTLVPTLKAAPLLRQCIRPLATNGRFRKFSDLSTPVTDNIEAKNFLHEARYTLPHPIWSDESTRAVKVTHVRPSGMVEVLSYMSVKMLRFGFDVVSGYALGRIDEKGWVNRITFLETVAGIPGMVGAGIRHFGSLGRMRGDYGWIHTLLEEAENERMHLMSILCVKNPSIFFRGSVLLTQTLFLPFYFTAYLLSPRYCHRFVGYLEEEAVITYSKLLKELEAGSLPLFQELEAPPVAKAYWHLRENATFYDMIQAIRADESHHREVNHEFANMRRRDPNPFPPGH